MIRKTIGIGIALAALALPAPASALRYASPTGVSTDCSTPATACDLETAVEGDGGSNVPSPGEEVIVLTGTYNVTTEVAQLVNLNVHGDFGQPRPQLNVPMATGRYLVGSGTLSYLSLDGDALSPLTMTGPSVVERVFVSGSFSQNQPVCQCYLGTLRNSVVVSTGTSPALGVNSNGGSGGATYRNVTAYSTNMNAPAIAIDQEGVAGTLTFTAYNVIARNAAGGTDVVADGPNSTITFHNSNYGSAVAIDPPASVDDNPPGSHQTLDPLFTNAAAFDFSELANSPTVNAGLTDALNGTVDFAGNPRVADGATDIGAYEYVPPTPPTPPGVGPPTFGLLGGKVKIKPNGKGALGLSCTSPTSDQCVVAGTLSTGASKRSTIGQVSGAVAGGSTGELVVKLTKRGRRALAARGKLRASVSGSVTNNAGLSAALSASLKLKPKR